MMSQPQDPTKQSIIAIIAGGLNLLLGLLVLVMIIMRFVSIMGAKEKMVTLDWIVLIGGFVIVAFKIMVAVTCVIYYFGTAPADLSTFKIMGMIAIVLNLLFVIFYVVALVIMGSLDPSGLTFNLLLIATILTVLELLTTIGYYLTLKEERTAPYYIYGTPSREQIPYMPVLQLAP